MTGQARMSYRRAAEIFATLTQPLDPAGRGWTLHQLSAAGRARGASQAMSPELRHRERRGVGVEFVAAFR